MIRQVEERFETDRFGVDTCTLKVEIPDSIFPAQVLPSYATHPRFTSLALSRRSGMRTKPGWWTMTYFFEGFLLEIPEPVYELDGGLDQEPIQAHPDFVDVLAGTPSEPLNGAIFIDPETGQITEDDDIGVFQEFAAVVSGARNPKAGVEAYLVPGAKWREITFSTTRPTALSSLGTIGAPSGPNPSLTGRNWLAWSMRYVRRGHIYQTTKTWKLSGPNGWDSDIY